MANRLEDAQGRLPYKDNPGSTDVRNTTNPHKTNKSEPPQSQRDQPSNYKAKPFIKGVPRGKAPRFPFCFLFGKYHQTRLAFAGVLPAKA